MVNETREIGPGEDTSLRSSQRPGPLTSLLASARRITGKQMKRSGGAVFSTADWQNDAWEMYDLVGEQRFLSGTLSGRLGQARFFVGELPDDPTEQIVPVEEGLPKEIFDALHGSGVQFSQNITRLGINLFVAGDGWLLGTPKESEQEAEERSGESTPSAAPSVDRLQPTAPAEGADSDDGGIDPKTLEWRMLSTRELSKETAGSREVIVVKENGESGGRSKGKTYDPDEVILIRVWRSHPAHWWEADSPTRASLPVLRELVGLTMHISAQVDSRLAGAGLLLVPTEASDALKAQLTSDEENVVEDSDVDPLTEALVEAMITPINDRSSASAVVPLVLRVPGDSIQNFKHLAFSGALDPGAQSMREEAIRRLALGQDCPPELLLGVAGMNHWGAWLVREDVVTTHLEPPLALVSDAITTQYLWPMLEEAGMETEKARRFVIWYDVGHLITRPNRSDDAKALHTAGVLSDEALRDASGFDDSHAPEEVAQLDPAVSAALDMVRAAPSLAQDPGLVNLVAQLREILSGETPAPAADPEQPSEEGEPSNEDGPPASDDTDAPADTPADDSIAASTVGPGMREVDGPRDLDSALERLARAARSQPRELKLRHEEADAQ